MAQFSSSEMTDSFTWKLVYIENLIALKIVSIIAQNLIVRKYKVLIVLKSGKCTRMSTAVLRVYKTPEVFNADKTFGCNPINHHVGEFFYSRFRP